MGSVDEVDVEKQERAEVQEQWSENIAEGKAAGMSEPRAADTAGESASAAAAAVDAPAAPVRSAAAQADAGAGDTAGAHADAGTAVVHSVSYLGRRRQIFRNAGAVCTESFACLDGFRCSS
jgi:hypothetical protein